MTRFTHHVAALRADESGFVITAELVLVGTIVVLGLTATLVGVRNAIGGEMTEIANAFRNLDQSYYYRGMRSRGRHGVKAWTAGSFHGRVPEELTVIEHEAEILCPEPVYYPPAPVLPLPQAVPQAPPVIALPPVPHLPAPCQPVPQLPTPCPPVTVLPAPLQTAPICPPETVVPCPPETAQPCLPLPVPAVNSTAPATRYPHGQPRQPSAQPLVW